MISDGFLQRGDEILSLPGRQKNSPALIPPMWPHPQHDFSRCLYQCAVFKSDGAIAAINDSAFHDVLQILCGADVK
jgi:hypothetical protein